MGIFRKFVHFYNKCKLRRRRFHWTLKNNIWKFNVLSLFIKMKIAIEQSTHIFFCILLFLPSHRIGDLTQKEVLNYSETAFFPSDAAAIEEDICKLGLRSVHSGVLSKWECFIKIRAPFPAHILPWVMKEGESKKAALILMKNSHCDRTRQ